MAAPRREPVERVHTCCPQPRRSSGVEGRDGVLPVGACATDLAGFSQVSELPDKDSSPGGPPSNQWSRLPNSVELAIRNWGAPLFAPESVVRTPFERIAVYSNPRQSRSVNSAVSASASTSRQMRALGSWGVPVSDRLALGQFAVRFDLHVSWPRGEQVGVDGVSDGWHVVVAHAIVGPDASGADVRFPQVARRPRQQPRRW